MTSHDRMQSILKRTTSGTSKPPASSDNAIPHKHSRRLQITQKHLPHAARTIKMRPDPITTSMLIYSVSQEERTKLREGVPYVKLYQYNPKHLYPKLNGYGDNGK